jgi:hypothetical protein
MVIVIHDMVTSHGMVAAFGEERGTEPRASRFVGYKKGLLYA